MSCKYFENRDCEYYPCHDMENLNCMFCFCPLYSMDCRGNFLMIEDKEGMLIKDCSKCLIPHSKNGYDYIIEKLQHTNKKEGA